MNKKEHIDLVLAYLDGSITAENRSRLNDLIEADKIDILEVKAMENTYHRLGELPLPEPSPEMSRNFRATLQDRMQHSDTYGSSSFMEQLKALLTPRKAGFAAFALSIFLLGMLAGNIFTPFRDYNQRLDRLSGEISQMREVMMMSLLDAQSPSERLKAVNISTDIRPSDSRVTSALLKTLNNDPNVNVRLASIEALLRLADNPDVRRGLIESISRQQSPLIQVALADAMLALQEERSVDELQQLLNRPELDSGVRNKLENTIAELRATNVQS